MLGSEVEIEFKSEVEIEVQIKRFNAKLSDFISTIAQVSWLEIDFASDTRISRFPDHTFRIRMRSCSKRPDQEIRNTLEYEIVGLDLYHYDLIPVRNVWSGIGQFLIIVVGLRQIASDLIQVRLDLSRMRFDDFWSEIISLQPFSNVVRYIFSSVYQF